MSVCVCAAGVCCRCVLLVCVLLVCVLLSMSALSGHTALPLVQHTLSVTRCHLPVRRLHCCTCIHMYLSLFPLSLSHSLCVNVVVVALVFVTWRNAIKLRYQSVAMPKKFGFVVVVASSSSLRHLTEFQKLLRMLLPGGGDGMYQ